MRCQQRVDALVLRRVIVKPQAQQDVDDRSSVSGLAARLAGRVLVAQVLRHGLIHLLDGQWRGMRGLEQTPDAPRVGLGLPGGDRVVGLDREIPYIPYR
jgi:hypothetical protein